MRQCEYVSEHSAAQPSVYVIASGSMSHIKPRCAARTANARGKPRGVISSRVIRSIHHGRLGTLIGLSFGSARANPGFVGFAPVVPPPLRLAGQGEVILRNGAAEGEEAKVQAAGAVVDGVVKSASDLAQVAHAASAVGFFLCDG